MSGGSYDYLCWKEAADLLENPYQLGEMATDLKVHFPGSLAAKDTDDLVRLIAHYRAEVERRRSLLEDVWHAQEWWQSNDYGSDQVQEAVEKYYQDSAKVRS